jgi:serine/threonine protein kinase
MAPSSMAAGGEPLDEVGANILVDEDGVLKITDFGIARITDSSRTKTGMVLGTPSYMSPEQIAGKKVDGRSDLFSLSVMLYHLCTGKLPFTADSMATPCSEKAYGKVLRFEVAICDLKRGGRPRRAAICPVCLHRAGRGDAVERSAQPARRRPLPPGPSTSGGAIRCG